MSAAIKNGGQAFPHADPQALHAIAAAAIEGITDGAERDRIYTQVRGQAAQGLTVRDYFAAQAIQGACDRYGGLPETPMHMESIASRAYVLADAMLRAREGDAL